MVNSHRNSAKDDAHETRRALLDCVRRLTGLLRETRRALALEYRVPYETYQRGEF
jgi:chloramphenicol 3-O-phosphotransferase